MANWDPFDEVRRLEEELDEIFAKFWGGTRAGRALPGRSSLKELSPSVLLMRPDADIVEHDNDVVVKINLPGVDKKDVKIKVTEDTVSVSGEMKKEKKENTESYVLEERYYGSFSRVLPLPAKVEPDKAQAKFENGVLEITVPKAETAKKSKEISL
ncbi:MAG: Hsp20/alpha crystallin family protein [Caldisericaceae bacterium]